MSDARGVALVTGASSGIGRAISEALASRGMQLVLCGRDPGRLSEVAAALRTAAPPVTVAVDLAGEGAAERIARRIDEMGRLDVLVHAAGVLRLGRLTDTAEHLDELYRINLRAPVLLTAALLPALRAARGQVVFVNSSAVTAPGAVNGLYAATKAGLLAFANALRQEVNQDGIRVLSVFAGRTATAMARTVSAFEGSRYEAEQLLQPADVARAVADALALPDTAELMDLTIRPMHKPLERAK